MQPNLREKLMAENVGNAGPIVVPNGPFRGWMSWSEGADPFETAIGPFCFRGEGADLRCGFEPTPSHLNGGGTVHGGALMSFADFALFAIAHNDLAGAKAVTVAFNCEFLAPGGLGAMIEAKGEVLRATRSLVFVRGLMMQEARTLLAFSGALKKITV
jgi:acyl-coenzyme A thioesterase 13